MDTYTLNPKEFIEGTGSKEIMEIDFKHELGKKRARIKKYVHSNNTQPILLQCRNTYELHMLHKKAEKYPQLIHKTVKSDLTQNKLRSVKLKEREDAVYPEDSWSDEEFSVNFKTHEIEEIKNDKCPIYYLKIYKK